MARVTLDRVRKTYEPDNVVVRDVSLDIADGEFVVLVGPSGCGKTTTLRLIAGLEVITSGAVAIGGRVVNDVPPKERDIAMVFQNYALYPHMSVRENMAFALELRRLPATEISTRVGHAAEVLGLDELLDRKPKELSGGQRQRVAIGRAIVRQPQVFLFDEPLSNLDAQLRLEMRREIARIHREFRATTIYVTHDQVEAMTMGDRIVVMERGAVQQVDAPRVIYERPANRFVATFMGSPPMNLIDGRVDGGVFHAPHDTLSFPLARLGDRPVTIGVRPEHLRPSPNGTIRARVELVEPLGPEALLHVRFADGALTARVSPDAAPSIGSEVTLGIDLDQVHTFDPATGARI